METQRWFLYAIKILYGASFIIAFKLLCLRVIHLTIKQCFLLAFFLIMFIFCHVVLCKIFPFLKYLFFSKKKCTSLLCRNVKKNVAHYLHDQILQNVFVLNSLIESFASPHPEVQKILTSSCKDLIQSIRNKTYDLYPIPSDGLTLSDNIHILCEKLKSSMSSKTHLFLFIYNDDTFQIDDQLSQAIFRVTKELVQNALKHAKAQNALLFLYTNQKYLDLYVIDDGIGFDAHSQERKCLYGNHIGLLSVQQDIHDMYGNSSIHSDVQWGTSIHVKIPRKKE